MTDFLSMTVQQVEGLPEAKAQEVLDAWVKAKKPELPQALAQSGSKAHVKLAKKALYRLQSSGVAVVSEAPKPAAPVVAAEAPKNEFPAVLSMQLGTGERAFLFGIPMRGGGLEVFSGIVTDEFGLAQLGSDRANRNTYRKRMDALRSDLSARVMLVPIERARLELGRAITMNERSKTPYGADVEQALSRAGITREDPDVVIPPLEPGDAEGRESGASLHELFEITPWLPSEKSLAALGAQVDAIRNGPLPLSDEQKDQKVLTIARALANESFTPEVRMLYARRLWYTAEVTDFHQRPEDSAKVRAEARRLAHETVPSRFAEQLFEKALPAKK
jgi:hypothetical protein